MAASGAFASSVAVEVKMGFYLALKEIWRNRGRFVLFSFVIALITVLVLFIAALADGLGNGNKEYIEKLNGELIVFKKNVDLNIGASRLDRSVMAEVRRFPQVADAGQASFANVGLLYGEGKKLNVALIGVEPGKPGEPPVVSGNGLADKRGKDAIIDRNVALRTGFKLGDELTIRVIQGTREEFFTLRVSGISDGRQYSLQPAIIVPLLTFERIKPQVAVNPNAADLISNIVVVKLHPDADVATMRGVLESQARDVEVVTLKTAYENTPGYAAQQSTLSTQQFFSLLVGILVIGGFFQIQTLQKVPQIGMLKAIGAPNGTIAVAAVVQIFIVTLMGVAIGTGVTLGLAFAIPATVPIAFAPSAIILGIAALMTVGPVGGLVSVRYALRVEPLTALGLGG
jgi:putative ABC transport system permease protein